MGTFKLKFRGQSAFRDLPLLEGTIRVRGAQVCTTVVCLELVESSRTFRGSLPGQKAGGEETRIFALSARPRIVSSLPGRIVGIAPGKMAIAQVHGRDDGGGLLRTSIRAFVRWERHTSCLLVFFADRRVPLSCVLAPQAQGPGPFGFLPVESTAGNIPWPWPVRPAVRHRQCTDSSRASSPRPIRLRGSKRKKTRGLGVSPRPRTRNDIGNFQARG